MRTWVFRRPSFEVYRVPANRKITPRQGTWKQIMFLEDFAALSVFADNGAAETGGVLVGRPYRTSSGVVMVRY